MPRALRSNTKLYVDNDRVPLVRAAKKNWIDTSKFEKKIKSLQAKLKTSRETVRRLEREDWNVRSENARLNAAATLMDQERAKYTEAYKELEVEKKKLEESETNTEKTAPLVCKICWLPYTSDRSGSPRVFNCGHSVCLFCATQIDAERLDRYGPKGAIRCPFCRQETPVENGAESLKKNFSIFDSLPSVPSAEPEEGVVIELPAPAPEVPAVVPEAPAPQPPSRSLLSRLSLSLFGRSL